MFANQDVIATIAVRNIDVARHFYGQILGLKPVDSAEEEVLTYQSGKAQLLVYVSAFAGTNQATSATWSVGEAFDSIMAALRAKGVVFERYDMPGMSFKDGVHANGEFRGAWFKDPDGNILHVLNQ